LYSHIKKGRVSYELDSDENKVFDTAELQRAYGELKNTNTPNERLEKRAIEQDNTPKVVQILHQQISDLKEQAEVLREEKAQDREEYRKEKEQLWRQLETQTLLLEDKREAPQPQNTISLKVLWIFLPICALMTAMPFIAWFLLDFLKQ